MQDKNGLIWVFIIFHTFQTIKGDEKIEKDRQCDINERNFSPMFLNGKYNKSPKKDGRKQNLP